MKHQINDSLLTLRTIKGLDPAEQARILRSLVPQFADKASKIRNSLEVKSRGVVKISLDGPDGVLILLALMTVVADDIGSVPDSIRVTSLMRIHAAVAAELRLDQFDIQFFSSNFDIVLKILQG